MSDQVELSGPPLDTPSFVRFSPTDPNLLLVGAWDATTRVYDVAANAPRAKFDHRAAILAGCWGASGTHAYVGGLETRVCEVDVRSEEVRVLGLHEKAVSTVVYAPEQSVVISGSWDRTLRVWDPKSANALQSTLPLPERAYKADLVGTTLVLALGSRLFHIYDTRALSRGPVQTRESALKFLTRSVAVMAGGEGYAAGSVEGRVAVEYTDAGAAAQERKYAFKCHRAAAGDVDHVWAVNALAFHPTYNTFASGGADGTVSVWDHTSKKRLRQLPKFGAGVAALAFAPDGGRLAVAAGYGWDEGGAAGAAAAGPASLHVFTLGDDAKPKGWTGP